MLTTAWPLPQLEIELKYLLMGVESYEKLLEVTESQIISNETFTTYYLDTKKKHLKDAGFNFRMRLGDEKAKMTLKFATVLHWDGESSPKMRWELEDEVDRTLAKQLVEGKGDLSKFQNRGALMLQANLPDSKLSNLKVLGQLDIQRHTVKWEKGIVLEVDRFEIAGETIYEIEIEVKNQDPDSVHEAFTAQLEKWKIPYRDTTTSKRSRLFASLGKSKNP